MTGALFSLGLGCNRFELAASRRLFPAVMIRGSRTSRSRWGGKDVGRLEPVLESVDSVMAMSLSQRPDLQDPRRRRG
jgi:hypothetical protein